jgi:LPS biosynthesis protein
MNQTTIKQLQLKILEIMKYIDKCCRDNKIEYYLLGGSALGAVRHEGFIPWDDDLDIIMTYDNYVKFKNVFNHNNDSRFVIQEWRTCNEYLEYSKVRMNNTTFIEKNYKMNKEMHHGIYVDIMILHKSPKNKLLLNSVYLKSKYVTLYALSQRNWIPKIKSQKIMLNVLKILPNKSIVKSAYKTIYKYDNLKENFLYCYYITKSNLEQGCYDEEIFGKPVDIKFEDTTLLAPAKVEEYLKIRFGDYMKLPPEDQRKYAIHAEFYDAENNYDKYIN